METRQPPEWHDPLFDKPEQEPNPNGGKLAMASAAMGVFSLLVVCASGISAGLGAGAIICGVISLKRGDDGTALAKAGIIMGIMTICIALVLLCIYGMKYLLGGVANSITSIDI